MELCQAMMQDNTTVRYDQKYKQNEANTSILLITPPNNYLQPFSTSKGVSFTIRDKSSFSFSFIDFKWK